LSSRRIAFLELYLAIYPAIWLRHYAPNEIHFPYQFVNETNPFALSLILLAIVWHWVIFMEGAPFCNSSQGSGLAH
jgi:hypothetical protein